MTEGVNSSSFTVKEIVLEVRNDVKQLAEKIDRIDRQGSIGTRSELEDHEARIRASEGRLVIIEAQRNVEKDIGARKLAWGALAASLFGGLVWIGDVVAKFTHHA